ncbi:MAG: hypothetical protein ACTIKK_07790 [Agrococcus casei]|uniref:hypothetical protein n=1 Tax=Agrococcus casei TaxID=343512 RepID=UPI003F92F9C5
MSIRAGRVFLAFAGVLLVASLTWIGIVWFIADAVPGDFVAPSLIGFVALVLLVVGALTFSQFVEVSVGPDRITVRHVVGARRSVLLSEIDEVVLLQRLVLPGRGGVSAVPRVLLRHGDRTVLAFTPQERGVVEMLASHGLQSTVVSEPLTPIQASRRYPRSVSVGELLGGPMLWAALVIAVFAIAWVFWIVLR